jgi:cytochrome c556
MAALDRALDEKPAAEPVKPEKVASLTQLMKQASFAQNRLRRGVRRIDDDKEAKVRDAALLAAIAEATIYDDDRLETPGRREQWYRFCGQMRDSAGDLSRVLKATDKEGVERALRELGRSCDACHAAFR